jgi:hypothetical protein
VPSSTSRHGVLMLVITPVAPLPIHGATSAGSTLSHAARKVGRSGGGCSAHTRFSQSR